MAYKNERAAGRARRKLRVRARLTGTPERPRLSVFKSSKHIYAQLIDDIQGVTLASASTRDKANKTKKRATVAVAKEIGALLGQRALQKGVKKALFDRSGFRFHGKLKALADAAREKGLEF